MTKDRTSSIHTLNRRDTIAAGVGAAALTTVGFRTANALAQQGNYTPTVLITGSNRGIGLEFARQYTEAGWNVIATCRKPEKAEELQTVADANDNIVIEQLDVTDYARMDELATQYKDTPIDVLLNNAGIFTDLEKQDLGEFDYDDFERTMAVNAYGPLRMGQAFADHVAASQEKKMVTIVSGLGSVSLASRTGGSMYFYRMSKAAVNMALVTLHGDLKERGIIVGLVGPGMVKTRLLDASGYKGPALTPEESAAGVRDKISRLTSEDSGKFYNFDDRELPW